jgi:hypothetical protein
MKRGRPKKPAEERREIVLCHRLTKAEHGKLLTAAKKSGLSISEYARKKLVGR